MTLQIASLIFKPPVKAVSLLISIKYFMCGYFKSRLVTDTRWVLPLSSINQSMQQLRSTQGGNYSMWGQWDRYYPRLDQLSFIQQYSLCLFTLLSVFLSLSHTSGTSSLSISASVWHEIWQACIRMRQSYIVISPSYPLKLQKIGLSNISVSVRPKPYQHSHTTCWSKKLNLTQNLSEPLERHSNLLCKQNSKYVKRQKREPSTSIMKFTSESNKKTK